MFLCELAAKHCFPAEASSLQSRRHQPVPNAALREQLCLRTHERPDLVNSLTFVHATTVVEMLYTFRPTHSLPVHAPSPIYVAYLLTGYKGTVAQ